MYITYSIPMGVIAFIAASLSVIICRREKLRTDRRGALRMFLTRFLGLWWAVAAISLLFKTMGFTMDGQGDPFAAVNLVPFKTIAEYIENRNRVQIFGNMLVLFPFPALLYFNFPKMNNRNYLVTVLCVTVLIEPIQLLINVIANISANVIDIDDFLLNAAGCLLGLTALKLLKHMIQGKKRT